MMVPSADGQGFLARYLPSFQISVASFQSFPTFCQITTYLPVNSFDGVASLYTADATAFPPGSGMVKGRAAIGAMWKGMAEQVTDPKVTTIDVKRLGPAAAREIGTFSLKTKSSPPKEVTGKYVVVWERVGRDWKLATDIWNEGK